MAQAMERACFDYIMLEDTLMISDDLRRQHGDLPQARHHGAEARSGAARRADRREHQQHGRGRDLVDAGLSAVHAGAAVLRRSITSAGGGSAGTSSPAARTTRRRTSASTSCRHASSATTWPTSTSIFACSCGTAGTRTRSCSTARPAPTRTTPRCGRSTSSASTTNAAARSTPRPRRRAGRPSSRPAARRAAGSSPRRPPTASSRLPPALPAIKAYRDDVRARAAAAGRNPDEIKVLFLVAPVLGETEEEAEARFERIHTAPGYIEKALAEHQRPSPTSTSRSSISTRSCRS